MPRELTPLEQLQLMIPGYRGYKVKDLIWQDDMLVRRYMIDRLENANSNFSKMMSEVARRNPFDERLRVLDDLTSRIRELISDINSAQSGGVDVYARWKIHAEQLEQIYEYDLKLVGLASQVEKASIERNLDAANQALEELRRLWRDRTKLFYPPELAQ
ncbi:MAG: hypothetical protein L7H21_05405 [Sulfolobales archaeon]|nr:hypothetical protein [Sulfolobales archaeon]MCG2894060.1 hypothetical protein [Sulfolobales archaeon]MCG2911047.1 hypothetical protein [Sulfolobales archaeon]